MILPVADAKIQWQRNPISGSYAELIFLTKSRIYASGSCFLYPHTISLKS
jgi:hypothetical protein